MVYKKLVGFAGRKRCGKSSLCKFLKQQENGVVLTVANYLKYLCCDLLGMDYEELLTKKDDGTVLDVEADERWIRIISKRTNIPKSDLEMEIRGRRFTSVREILQVIGTDVIRKYNPNWHVEQLVNDIKSYPEDKPIFVDDVRFPNEREAIEKLGGTVFFMIRPNCKEVSNHSSEISLLWQDFNHDRIIINDNTEEQLRSMFLCFYINDYQVNGMWFLVYMNPEFLINSNYGVDANENDELFKDFLKQQKKSEIFMKGLFIEYSPKTPELAERFMKEISNKSYVLEPDQYKKFMIYNPLITENLKKYL